MLASLSITPGVRVNTNLLEVGRGVSCRPCMWQYEGEHAIAGRSILAASALTASTSACTLSRFVFKAHAATTVASRRYQYGAADNPRPPSYRLQLYIVLLMTAKWSARSRMTVFQVNGYDFTMVTHKKAVEYIKKHPVLNMLIARKGVTHS